MLFAIAQLASVTAVRLHLSSQGYINAVMENVAGVEHPGFGSLGRPPRMWMPTATAVPSVRRR
ncbi:hypothetical protein I545_5625 [Mycobacterium kansasii 662]|uniref:Uncharacterized protein n=2 Tax=Mycobacterium kansasii TaxID=1768 RepID=A0A1V3WHN0_MYCKA|nr:hypothetical protein I547_7350 [Mycobacterium kansasii 824]EUA11000.1 hypothetical protein I545_5625 [Mycobacterium kansasii 662]KEP42401.1 hypothetical protein MKSMC1_25530 [Mycobacterium kansasii]OOK66494.1 hypothetical protein BZL30_8348 [Mycobacterium kansasii]OOK77334.1 hypothetical protein BZL29_3143 [Mycobacterium kansasii]